MPPPPRNVRTRTPRPIGVGRRTRPGLHHTYRFGASTSPTPPPVVVSSQADEAPTEATTDPEAPASEPRVRVGLWAIFALLTLACLASAVAWRTLRNQHDWLAAIGARPAEDDEEEAVAPSRPKPPSSEKTGGFDVSHDGYEPLPGGVLHVPKSFEPSDDGHYDLIVHFHGNPAIVLESVEHAGLDAALAIINLGTRSGPYREAYRVPGAFGDLLARIRTGLERRGLDDPELGRLALTSWSAGYGAIESILEHRKSPEPDADPLDAIIALDGVHASYVDGDTDRLKERSIRTFVRAARSAAQGRIMMLLTHSQIPTPGFASAERTQRAILDRLEIDTPDAPVLPVPEQVELESARGAAEEDEPMVPIVDVRTGGLRMRGFEGETADHHAAHLTQMSPVALADLEQRWRAEP